MKMPKRLFHAGDRVKGIRFHGRGREILEGTVMGDVVWPMSWGPLLCYHVVWDGQTSSEECTLGEEARV